MKHSEALSTCESLIALLSPAFIRLEAVGSLRRGKADLDEIDLLGIPDLSPPPRARPEFGKPIPKAYDTKLDKLIDDLSSSGTIIPRANGPRQKKFYSLEHKIRVDLYVCKPPARWGVLQLIRTGPSDFGHWIVTRRRNGGALDNDYRIQGGAVYLGADPVNSLEGIEPIGFDTEFAFLEWLELGWIEPEDRVARWGKGNHS